MGKKLRKEFVIWLMIIITMIIKSTVYAADNRNATGYNINRNDGCSVTHVSKDLTNLFWDDQVNSGENYQWSIFNNSGAYTDSYSVNTDYGTADTYLCDKYDYNYIDVSNILFACGKYELINFLNNIEGAGLGFDSELTLPYDTNYLPVYTFMKCPFDGFLARLKINYYGFKCEYDNSYVITGIRYQTKCSNFGFEGQDAFGNSGWYAGFEFGYGGGYNYPHNHCYGHPNEYTITYDSNGGSGSISNLNCLYNSSYSLSNGGFIRPGWRLSGWRNIETNQTYGLGQSFTNLTAIHGKLFTMSAQWQDVTAPMINVQDNYGWTNQTVTINPQASDNESGMNNFELYDGSKLLTSGINALNYPFFSEQNRAYRLKAVDNAGNISYRDFNVRIDKTPPNITINGSKNSDVSTGWTNQKATINVSIDEALSGLANYKVSYADGTVLKEDNYSNTSDFIIEQRKYFITRAIQYMLGRKPINQFEIDNWHNVLISWGTDVQNNFGAEVFKQFYGNREYMDGYGSTLSNQQFVTMMYNFFLCRDYNPNTDNTIENNWATVLLDGGQNRTYIAQCFFSSVEYINLSKNYGFPTTATFKNNVSNDNFSFEIVTDGATTLNITTQDNVGNVRTQKVTVLINNDALKVNMPDYGWINQNVPIHITASNTTGVQTHYNLYNNDNWCWSDGWNNDSERYFWVSNEGISHWKCIAYDDAGNYAEATNTVKIDKTSPVINSGSVNATYNSLGKMSAIKVIANDYLSGINTISIYSSNNQLLNQVIGYGASSCGIDYIFNNTNYSDYYYVIATDIAGNTYQQIICAKYTSTHNKMNNDNKTYTLADTDVYLGVLGQNYNPGTRKYIGFATPNAQSIIVTWDGKAAVNYYYTLNKITIKFDGNGGTGIMPDIINNNPTISLPTHTYTKENASGKSTFLGWNMDPKAKKPLYMENASITIAEGTTELILYAIWDDSPIIIGTDRYYTLRDAQNGEITEVDLLKTVMVTDDWNTNFELLLKVTDYNPFEFKQFISSGTTLVKYQVTDDGGNTCYTQNIVYIVDTTTEVVQENKYVRFISPDYYQKENIEGGLGINSIWRTNPNYVAILEKAMVNRKSLVEETDIMSVFGIDYSYTKPGSVSQNHIYESWTFNSDEIKEVKEFIKIHSIGNIKEITALIKFLMEFSKCKM